MCVEEPKPIHFAYAAPEGDLKQGDVIMSARLAEPIRKRVVSRFPGMPSHLLVLTQSCDLVRRPAPKADFIALAPTRHLGDILEYELGRLQKTELAQRANVCGSNRRTTLEQFLERLLNNNNPDFFYLHQEPGFDLAEPACALLRCSLPFETRIEQYDSLLRARVLGLSEEFRAKLGWLVGNIYSRIGTRDWERSESRALINGYLSDICAWVDSKKLEAAEKWAKKNPEVSETPAQLRKRIEEMPVETKRESILKCIKRTAVGLDMSDKDPDEVAVDLCAMLEADAGFQEQTR